MAPELTTILWSQAVLLGPSMRGPPDGKAHRCFRAAALIARPWASLGGGPSAGHGACVAWRRHCLAWIFRLAMGIYIYIPVSLSDGAYRRVRLATDLVSVSAVRSRATFATASGSSHLRAHRDESLGMSLYLPWGTMDRMVWPCAAQGCANISCIGFAGPTSKRQQPFEAKGTRSGVLSDTVSLGGLEYLSPPVWP